MTITSEAVSPKMHMQPMVLGFLLLRRVEELAGAVLAGTLARRVAGAGEGEGAEQRLLLLRSAFSTILPSFTPMVLPSSVNGRPTLRVRGSLSTPPLQKFQRYFSDAVLSIIVVNTNKNVRANGAGQGKRWTDLTLDDMKRWLGIVIFMVSSTLD